MKKSLTVIVFTLLTTTSVFAQRTFSLHDLFKNDTIVWYGIDYSHANFIGTFTGKDLTVYFRGWNRLPLEEPFKYDIRRTLQKKILLYDTAYVETLNDRSEISVSSVPVDGMVTKEIIKNMLLNYKESVQSGIGFVLVAVSYDNLKHLGTHYAVLFDIASKKILISQEYQCSPGGTGVRNYWAGSIHEAFKLLAGNYPGWKKKYGKY